MEQSRHNTDEDSYHDADDEVCYYFAYGPVCHDLVRKRRGISVKEIRAAFLPEYRLTFAIGGLANIVPRRGFEVHGLLLELSSPEDWERIAKFDAGSTPSYRTVYAYDKKRDDGDYVNDKNCSPIRARLEEFSEDVADEILDSPLETLPQCRYLELIAQGMKRYGVDDDYIEDHIMGVPFVAKTQPEDYRTVPLEPLRGYKRRRRKDGLPRLDFDAYKNLCQEHQRQSGEQGDIFFIVNDGIFRIHPADHKIPAVKWLAANAHGKGDCSLLMHKLIVDPDIPLCDEQHELSPLHFAWVENRIVEQFIEKYNQTCRKVALLKTPPPSSSSSPKQVDGNDKDDSEKKNAHRNSASSASSSSLSFRGSFKQVFTSFRRSKTDDNGSS